VVLSCAILCVVFFLCSFALLLYVLGLVSCMDGGHGMAWVLVVYTILRGKNNKIQLASSVYVVKTDFELRDSILVCCCHRCCQVVNLTVVGTCDVFIRLPDPLGAREISIIEDPDGFLSMGCISGSRGS